MSTPIHPPAETSRHDYLSTACFHDECGSCRSTCKSCGSSCLHPCHPQSGDLPVSPVDQARDLTAELLAVIGAEGLDLTAVAPELAERLRTDPALFWARGEAMPPGQWQADPPHEKPPLRWHWGDDHRECSDCGAEVYAFEEGLICSKCDQEGKE